MEEPSSSPPPLSSKQQKKRAHSAAKQQKRQEQARKKRQQRGQQRARMNEALRKIGAQLEKGGKQKIASGRRAYTVQWRGQHYHFDALKEISRWAKQMQNPPPLDYAEHEAYQWRVDFVDEMVAPADKRAAEQLFLALEGKGAFRRFRETLHRIDERWLQAWYQWNETHVKATIDAWLKEILL
jgi:hypothetical protein